MVGKGSYLDATEVHAVFNHIRTAKLRWEADGTISLNNLLTALVGDGAGARSELAELIRNSLLETSGRELPRPRRQ